MLERNKIHLPDQWLDIIIESGKQGKHFTDFLITLGISYDQHQTLLEQNKSYAWAIREYEKFCEQYWFDLARQSMIEDNGMGFNSRLWTTIMKNKFPNHWNETQKMDITSNGDKIQNTPIQIEIIKNKDIE